LDLGIRVFGVKDLGFRLKTVSISLGLSKKLKDTVPPGNPKS
jgi:hypothetical protein